MAKSDWTLPTAAAGAGWSNPSNALAVDGSVATASMIGADTISGAIDVDDFDIVPPPDATIDGVEVRIKWNTTDGAKEHTVEISDGTTTSDNKSAGATLPSSGLATTTFGGSSDDWGETLTPAYIQTLEVTVKCQNDAAGDGTANIDSIEVRIHFTHGPTNGVETVQVSSSAGDAAEAEDSTGFSYSGSTLSHRFGAGTSSKRLGWWFAELPIPRDVFIDSSLLTLSIYSGSEVDGELFAQNDAAPDDFATDQDVTSRTLWTTATAWAETGLSGEVQSPNFADSIQDAIDGPGWNYLDDLTVVLKPTTTGSDTTTAFDAYDGDPASAAKLNIRWSDHSIHTYRILHGSDDATENGSGEVVAGGELNVYPGGYVGLRFQNVKIPDGGVLVSAKLSVTRKNGGSDFDCRIIGEEPSDTASFVADPRVSTRTLLAGNRTLWAETMSSNQRYESPDISGLVDAMLNDAAFNSGQSLAFIIEELADYGYGSNVVLENFESGAADGAEAMLILEWELDSFGLSSMSADSDLVCDITPLAIGTSSMESASQAEAAADADGSAATAIESVAITAALGTADDFGTLAAKSVSSMAGQADPIADVITSPTFTTDTEAAAIADGDAITNSNAIASHENTLSAISISSSQIDSSANVDSFTLGELLGVFSDSAAFLATGFTDGTAAAITGIKGSSTSRFDFDADGDVTSFARSASRNDVDADGDGTAKADTESTSKQAATLEVTAGALTVIDIDTMQPIEITPDGSVRYDVAAHLDEIIIGTAENSTLAAMRSDAVSYTDIVADGSATSSAIAISTYLPTLWADWFATMSTHSASELLAEATPDGTIKTAAASIVKTTTSGIADSATQTAVRAVTSSWADIAADGSALSPSLVNADLAAEGSVDWSAVAFANSISETTGRLSLDGAAKSAIASRLPTSIVGTADSATQSAMRLVTTGATGIEADSAIASPLLSSFSIDASGSVDWHLSLNAKSESKIRTEARPDGTIVVSKEAATDLATTGIADSATMADMPTVAASRTDIDADGSTTSPGVVAFNFTGVGSADWSVVTSFDSVSRSLQQLTLDGSVNFSIKAEPQSTTVGTADSATQAAMKAAAKNWTDIDADGSFMSPGVVSFDLAAEGASDWSAVTLINSTGQVVGQLSLDGSAKSAIATVPVVSITGDAQSATQAAMRSTTTGVIDATAASTINVPFLSLFGVTASGSVDWFLTSNAKGESELFTLATPDGSAKSFTTVRGQSFILGDAVSSTLASFVNVSKQFTAVEALASSSSPIRAYVTHEVTLFTDHHFGVNCDAMLSAIAAITPDGSAATNIATEIETAPTFHVWQSVATALTTVAAIEVGSRGEGFAASSLLSAARLLLSIEGERLASCRIDANTDGTFGVYGYGDASHEITANTLTAMMTGADGSTSSIANATATLDMGVTGLVPGMAAIETLGGVEVYCEPPRVIGDIVSQFATYYVGGGTAVVFAGESKGIVYNGRSVGISTLER